MANTRTTKLSFCIIKRQVSTTSPLIDKLHRRMCLVRVQTRRQFAPDKLYVKGVIQYARANRRGPPPPSLPGWGADASEVVVVQLGHCRCTISSRGKEARKGRQEKDPKRIEEKRKGKQRKEKERKDKKGRKEKKRGKNEMGEFTTRT